MEKNTLLAAIDFSRTRLNDLLATIEKAAPDARKALSWRPGPGRAHIGWQAMHCAATHDRYFNMFILGGSPKDEWLVRNYGGGSTPSDDEVPSFGIIHETLPRTLAPFREFVANITDTELQRKHKLPNGTERTVGESILLLAWHEGHHQGQIHLTWNCFKAAHGL